jgi:hypothetical protein
MSTYDDRFLAARFAALAPEPLAGNWDDVLRRAGVPLQDRQPSGRPRAREGHRRRFLIVLAAAIIVVVVGTAAAFGIRSFIVERGFIGLPPEGATPSSPASGELELFYMGNGDPGDKPGDGPGIRAWLYADGRLISWQTGSDLPESANLLSTGFLEQRLTPEGVELLRSEVVATGLFDHNRVLVHRGEGRPAPRFVDVRHGDRLVHLAAVAECANTQAPCLLPIPGATNATPEQANALSRLNARLSDPASWLPESAWADRDIRAYVSPKYAVCYGGWPPDQQIERSRVLALLPPAVRDQLGGDTKLRQGPLFGEPGNFRPSYEYCADLTTDEARAIAVALDDAGLERAGGANRLHYRIEAPGSNPGEASVYFEPYLPHGEIVCTVCG